MGTTLPAVGMGATIVLHSDRHACTIIKVTSQTVTVQRDTANRTDANGVSESQSYVYARNPQGVTERFWKNKHGIYQSASGGCLLSIGERNEYYDYSF